MTDSEFWQACVVAAIHSGKSAQDGVQMAGYAVAMQPVTPATPSALTYLAEADGVQPTEDDILLAKFVVEDRAYCSQVCRKKEEARYV